MNDAAASHLEAARRPGASVEEENGRPYLAIVRAELALAEGRLDGARAIVDTSAPRVAAMRIYVDGSEAIWQLVEIGLRRDGHSGRGCACGGRPGTGRGRARRCRNARQVRE